MPKVVFLFFFLIGILPRVFAADVDTTRAKGDLNYEKAVLHKEILKGIDMIYNSQFSQAEDIFRTIALSFPDMTAPRFYLAMVSWSRLASGYWYPSMVEQFRERLDHAIDMARTKIELNPSDAESYFFLGGALGFKGRFELMRERWFASFILASDAVTYLNKCLKIEPENKEVLLGLGIYEYYTARMSGILKFLSYLLIRKGDREEGLKKLHKAAKHAVYSASEAQSTLVHIYMFMEEEYEKALPLVSDLVERYPETSRYMFLKGVCHAMMEEKDLFEKTRSAIMYKALGSPSTVESLRWERIAVYLTAAYAMLGGNFDQAKVDLDRILKMADPDNDPSMIAWPLLKKAMIHDLLKEREQAIDVYRKVLDMENASGAQFLAKRYLANPILKGDPFIGY
ncbi:MAG: hypothetical protein C4582_05810 [Desulfobacteraceae bacterium]|jgi:tetratricopeptide (TPR) repeat protein|nr:MAG: hypothetical protein C4582_05810 [Desulfobacteraceae bacterium]